MPQSLAALYCHLVFSTRERQPLIGEELEPRLYEFIGGIVRARKCVLLAAGGMPDHVHLLVSMGREWAVADLVRDIKSNSSGWIHETFPSLAHFFWQGGYGAFSVGIPQLPAVHAYIAAQKEHHSSRSFQDEYRQLLTEHGLKWDERYVWE